jgi:hypothetical protein
MKILILITVVVSLYGIWKIYEKLSKLDNEVEELKKEQENDRKK